MRLKYPVTGTVDQVDTYHGVAVSDPYRWLEDEADPERPAWIAAQNALTEQFLAQLPIRHALRDRFEQLLQYPRYYDFYRRGPYVFYLKNDGLQSQLILYRQHGLTGTPSVLVDPQEFAADGTVRLTSVALSRDARYLAYGLSQGGGDWQEYRVKEMHTGRDLADRIRWVKGSAVCWRGDGFYYSRYPPPTDLRRALSAPNQYHQVWYHRVGTAQSADDLMYEDRRHPLRLHVAQTTEDERFVVLTIADGADGPPGTAVWLLDSLKPDQGFTPLISAMDDKFGLVAVQGTGLLFLTNHRAPHCRLVLIDSSRPKEADWREVIPEREHVLERVTAIGRKLFAIYREDATHRIYVANQAGQLEHEIQLPGPGVVQVFSGQDTDREALWSFATFSVPPMTYRYDIASRQSVPFLPQVTRFDPDDFRTHQVFYDSKDGTRIPMFLVHRKELVLDGRHPSLLYGYGGSGIPVGPAFDPLTIALLERGVVFAVACLRGGGEYGEAWHRAGWRKNKQTVFDDCIAAAEWLQANGYTSRDRAALIGASNGGLLVGAVMTQRPDLFSVALPCAGVLDMLRFQHFTMGRVSTSEYGSSEDPEMFPVLLSYSPLHNLREGVHYPATLIVTSEHDDRVVPAHSFKFIATLQKKGARSRPYLIRIDSRSGHSAVSLPKELDERADLYAFLLAHLPNATLAAEHATLSSMVLG